MEEIKNKITNHDLFSKWEYLNQNWSKLFPETNSLVIVDGVDSDDVVKSKTQAIQSWLFKIEFIDCIFALNQNSIIFMGSKDKVNFLDFLTNLF